MFNHIYQISLYSTVTTQNHPSPPTHWNRSTRPTKQEAYFMKSRNFCGKQQMFAKRELGAKVHFKCFCLNGPKVFVMQLGVHIYVVSASAKNDSMCLFSPQVYGIGK